MLQFISAAPKVTLTKAFSSPFDNAVATARTCYASRVIWDHDVSKSEESRALRDKIAQSTFLAGHHTTLQHAHFQFAIENISRQALWGFFHAHPFYNSEQVSQRYVEVKDDRFIVPKLKSEALQERYLQTIKRQQQTYHTLISSLHEVAEDHFLQVFPGRKKNRSDKRWQNAIKKRCQEVARYVLPVGIHAHLYHTISGLTLYRYRRLAESFDCPSEQKILIDAMVQAVEGLDPSFFKFQEETMDFNETHEIKAARIDPSLSAGSLLAERFVTQFDQKLGSKCSLLISHTPNAEGLLTFAVQQILGLPEGSLDKNEAIQWLLHPQKNPYLAEALNLHTLGKMTRALDLVHFSFQKKLSHSADSQAQRHRMTPGARPILYKHVVPGKADYITPSLFFAEKAQKAKAIFDEEQHRTADDIAFMIQSGVPPEAWQYLLPNAFPVRYVESGSLLDHHHKWSSRLCYNAQEEIWQASMDEVRAVEALFPQIGALLLPPCGLRHLAKKTPICPEGERFCGVTVWKLPKESYVRLL